MSRARDIADSKPSLVSDQANTSTGYLDLPSGTTAQRPTLDNAGGTRFNTTTGSLEFYDGTNWVSTNLTPTINSITGGIYATASNTLTLSLTNATDTIDVKYYEGNTLLATDTGVTVTNGSASSTVPSAVYGQTVGDTISIQVFNQDGTPSSNNIVKTVTALPTGGTITGPTGGYFYHTFTAGGTFTNTIANLSVDYLVVAGGGGGSRYCGGGAGGVLDSTTTLSVTPYSVFIGGGGSSGSANGSNSGTKGVNSSFGSFTASGGGAGISHAGGYSSSIQDGGSGAGGDSNPASQGGAGTTGQGSAGGSGANNTSIAVYTGGGGGGKGGAGETAIPGTRAGNGGAGLNWKSLGTFYGGGGGGATYGSGAGGTGGSSIGGNGATDLNTTGSSGSTSGAINRGAGGGGGGLGDGGSGIVIIRYQLP